MSDFTLEELKLKRADIVEEIDIAVGYDEVNNLENQLEEVEHMIFQLENELEFKGEYH